MVSSSCTTLIRRQPAVALRSVHRTARRHDAHAQALRGGNLDVDRVIRGRAGRRNDGRWWWCSRTAAAPPARAVAAASSASGVSRAQIGYSAVSQPNNSPVQRGRHGAGQGLVEMVVRVDQPGQHDVRCRRRTPRRQAWRVRRRQAPVRRCGRPAPPRRRSAPSARIAERVLQPEWPRGVPAVTPAPGTAAPASPAGTA